MVRARFVTALGLRTRVLEAGEGDRGDPVVLVHGVGGWAENWAEVLAPIAATGRRVFAVDLPGFGESERPRTSRYFDPDDPFYARFVVALLDALEAPRAHLVGNSLGGAVVYTAAVTAPSRARSLVFVAGAGLGLDIALSLRLTTLPGMGLLAHLPRRPEAADAVLRSCFWDWSRIPEHLYAEARDYGNRSLGEFIRVLRSGATIRGVKPKLRRRWIERTAAFGGPVLAIWGRQDAVLPVTHAAAVPELFPQAEVRLIDACGHIPMAEKPAEFLGALLPFLDRSEARPRHQVPV